MATLAVEDLAVEFAAWPRGRRVVPVQRPRSRASSSNGAGKTTAFNAITGY